MIMAPTSDFSSDDADKILTYVENGGKLFMVTAADCDIAGDMPNLQKILDYFNVTVEPGLIFEGNANYYYQVPFYLLPEVNYSEYTSDFYSSKYIFMPYAQAITVEEDDEVYYTSILSATEDAYIKQNIDTMTTYDKEEGNLTGPFDLAVFVEKTTDTADSQLFLFGSEALFTDSADQIVSGTNLTLFNNSISSYISEQEGSVSVPVKSYEEDYLTVSQGMVLLWGAVVILMIPLALLAAGLIIWIRRRKK
jgi:ABC-2 type transport system permease protein